MTFKETLLATLDKDDYQEDAPGPGDVEKYELNPKLTSSLVVFNDSPSVIIFDFDAEGNLLEMRTVLVDEPEALRIIAGHEALDEDHSDILLCSAEHIEEADGHTPPPKEYLN
jgi:hypothetical protein